jgi:hypothetical protein
MTTFIWTGVALWLGLNAAVAAFACTILSQVEATNDNHSFASEYSVHSDLRNLQ